MLGARTPSPSAATSLGGTVEVVSSFHEHKMSFPVVHPANAVCVISQFRTHAGATTTIYRTLRRSTITFFSTYEHASNAMMPAMLGHLTVR